MSRDAKECDYCNNLFCSLCIEGWLVFHENCPMCAKDIKIRGASRVIKEIIVSFKIRCQFCPKEIEISKIDKHQSVCGKILCSNPLCKKALSNQKYLQIITSSGKICVCNEECEQMAKFDQLMKKMTYKDCLKFFQSSLSSGMSI